MSRGALSCALLFVVGCLSSSARAEGPDVTNRLQRYYQSCLKAMIVEGRKAELVCACAAGVFVAQDARRRPADEASAVAQDCYPAFKDN